MIDGPWPFVPRVLTTQLWKHTLMFVLKPPKNSSHSIITLAHSLLHKTQHLHERERMRQPWIILSENKISLELWLIKGCSEKMNWMYRAVHWKKQLLPVVGVGSVQSEKTFWKFLWEGAITEGSVLELIIQSDGPSQEGGLAGRWYSPGSWILK